MASEVGQGYVSIIPSARGFAAALQREIGSDLARAGRRGGDDFGKSFSTAATAKAKNTGNDVARRVGADAKRGGEKAGDQFGKAFADEAIDSADRADIGGGISDKMKVGLAAGAAAAGAVLVAGIGEALERGRLESKLAAQLGGGPRTERATRAASDLFAGAWGESVADVNDAVSSVVTNIGGMRRASEADLERVTASVLDIATAFDQEASAITRTIDQMVRTDMASNPREALDIITRGFQSGANEADDLLDTFNEYSTQFRKLGIDGDEAMGLLTQGLRAGARDADVVADAFKEFSIRAVDGSDLTQSAFHDLGLSADDMEDKIARGGQSAADATALVLDKLRRVKDPADRAQIAVGLFGTQSEDLGDALFALDPTNAVDTLGRVGGAAKRMGKTLNDNAATELESFKRQLQTRFVNFLGNEVIPAAQDLWRDVGPDVKRFGHALMNMGEDIGPVVKDVLPVFADVLGDVAGAVGAFARQFSKLPGPLQAALIGGGLFALARRKGGGGIPFLPSLAPAAAPAAATAAGAGAGTAAAGGAVAGGAAARVVGGARAAGIAAIALYGGQKTVSAIQDIGAEAPKIDALGTSLRNMSTFGAGRLPGEMEDLSNTVERLTSDSMAHRFERWAGSYDQESEEVRNLDNAFVRLANERGLPAARRAFRQMADSEDLTAEETKDLISILPGYRRLLNGASDATGKHAKDLDAAREAGWDLLGLWRQNLIPSTKNLSDKFGLTSKEADLLRREMGDATGTAKEHEKQLRQVARQMGLNKQETQDLIDKYGDIPKRVETRAEFLTREAADARDQFLRDTKGKFSDLGNETYAIMVNGQSGHGRLFEADGGIVKFFAAGGLERHVAQIARPGTTRVWNEPETGGEAYIPLAASKRGRSLDVWAQAGRELGVQGFADGGIAGQVNTRVRMDLSQLRQLVRETVRGLAAAGGSVPATLAWAKRQVGDPYLMGGTGPNAWDCSGFMSGITHHLLGQDPNGPRLFYTGNFPTSMFARGPGIFSIGSTPDAGGGIGHMAGTLGGVNVESSGGVGVRVGGGARGARDPLFGGNVWHLKQGLIKQVIAGGRGDVGAQGGLSPAERWIVGRESGGSTTANNPTSSAFGLGQLLSSNRVAYARRLGLNWHRETGDTGTTSYDAQLAMMRMYIKDRYGSAGAAKNFWLRNGYYDQGGVLKPGYTMAYNGTGRDEYVTKEPPRRSRGPQRIVLDAGSIGRLSGWIDDRIDGALDFEASR